MYNKGQGSRDRKNTSMFNGKYTIVSHATRCSFTQVTQKIKKKHKAYSMQKSLSLDVTTIVLNKTQQLNIVFKENVSVSVSIVSRFVQYAPNSLVLLLAT